MKRVLLTIILLLSMIAFSACGSSTTSSDDGTQPEEQAEVQTEQTEANALEPVKIIVTDEEDGWINYYVYVKNNTSNPINTVTVNMSHMDGEGNVLDGSYPQIPIRILPGQSAAIDGLVEKGETQTIKPDGYSYYDAKGDFVEGVFDSALEAVSVKKSGTTEYVEEPAFEGSAIEKDVVLSEHDSELTLEKIENKGEKDGFKNFAATVKNNTDKTINTITVSMIMLDDKGNICSTTYPQMPNRIEPGQSITIDGLTDLKEAKYFTVDNFSYFEGDRPDGEPISGYFSTIPKAVTLK